VHRVGSWGWGLEVKHERCCVRSCVYSVSNFAHVSRQASIGVASQKGPLHTIRAEFGRVGG
jgi:hypothetical protein